jgi:hypothetical protein
MKMDIDSLLDNINFEDDVAHLDKPKLVELLIAFKNQIDSETKLIKSYESTIASIYETMITQAEALDILKVRSIIAIKHLFDNNKLIIYTEADDDSGYFNLTTDEDLINFLNDRVGFFAKRNRLTKEQYLDWKSIIGDWYKYSTCPLQCCGKTKNGDRCKNTIETRFTPKEYLSNIHKSVFCRLHK